VDVFLKHGVVMYAVPLLLLVQIQLRYDLTFSSLCRRKHGNFNPDSSGVIFSRCFMQSVARYSHFVGKLNK